MDNTTILFNAIQRVYRNQIVGLIRERMHLNFGNQGIEEIQSIFSAKTKLDDGRSVTQWDLVKLAAHERRAGGTEELSTPISDDYELVGVEYFFNVFEKFFPILCPKHATRSKKEVTQARQALLTWMKQIKNFRDPISHPVTEDVGYDDAVNVLYNARKVLDFCDLPDGGAQLLRLQGQLLGGVSSEQLKIHAVLPPADEVVMDFVGRHKELALLNEWVESKSSKRRFLSGEGGKGKSAIAYAFARNVAARDDSSFQAVIWMSAKRRRFIEGHTILVDRPDFFDLRSSLNCILAAFGEEPTQDTDFDEARVVECLSDFPSLLVLDDLDTIEEDGEDAVTFLTSTIPERTKSLILVTSRRAVFGMARVTTQVAGLCAEDADSFLRSRCDLMGLSAHKILALKESILEVCDASPLFIEDLLRLIQTGLAPDSAVGLWAEKRGTEARKYAIQREFDQLDDDARQALLALALQGPSTTDVICRGLNWNIERLLDALQQLRKMFLMPNSEGTEDKHEIALNRNVRTLVLDVFSQSDAYNRVERSMKAATGELRTKRREDEDVTQLLRRGRLSVQKGESRIAKAECEEALRRYPGRSDLYAHLGWIERKMGDVPAARLSFQRADELRCTLRDAYWHWSDMEATCAEWQKSGEVAAKGIAKFGEDQGLLFRLGYALHRQGRELIEDGMPSKGQRLCMRALEVLEKARLRDDSEDRHCTIKRQIYRAIALNLEALEDGPALARHFAAWQGQCAGDLDFETEHARIRKKYPEYLRAH